MSVELLYDEPQEAAWFKSLHPSLARAAEFPISEARTWPGVSDVLSYDRPDIVLLADHRPILVVEETVEVPSGHNVGQRFARLAASAEQGVPTLYFGPYVARKHGGETEGPRYMNLRLFKAIDAMIRVTGAAVTSICWHVDDRCEVRRDRAKDDDVREYLKQLLEAYNTVGPRQLNEAMLRSPIHAAMHEERQKFISERIRRAEQYDRPPESVEILTRESFNKRLGLGNILSEGFSQVVLYKVGMRKIRSDPYTGMAILYHYLYIAEHPERRLFLWFPDVSLSAWKTAAQRPDRKDIRLFKHAADGILFRDAFCLKGDL